jgi:hypothetical protein
MNTDAGWHPMVVLAALIVTGYRGGQNVYRYGVGASGCRFGVGPAPARIVTR